MTFCLRLKGVAFRGWGLPSGGGEAAEVMGGSRCWPGCWAPGQWGGDLSCSLPLPTTLTFSPSEVVDVFTVFKNTLWGGDRGEKSANTFLRPRTPGPPPHFIPSAQSPQRWCGQTQRTGEILDTKSCLVCPKAHLGSHHSHCPTVTHSGWDTGAPAMAGRLPGCRRPGCDRPAQTQNLPTEALFPGWGGGLELSTDTRVLGHIQPLLSSSDGRESRQAGDLGHPHHELQILS